MYFIVNIFGKQYKIFKGLKFKIDNIKLKENSLLILNNVLLFSSKKYFIIDKFFLKKIFLVFRILVHYKQKKINVLKFRRRKNYKKNIIFKRNFTYLILENLDMELFKFYFNYGKKKIRRFF